MCIVKLERQLSETSISLKRMNDGAVKLEQKVSYLEKVFLHSHSSSNKKYAYYISLSLYFYFFPL
jgi:hypothetical protein